MRSAATNDQRPVDAEDFVEPEARPRQTPEARGGVEGGEQRRKGEGKEHEGIAPCPSLFRLPRVFFLHSSPPGIEV
jgi:hypothetical protein